MTHWQLCSALIGVLLIVPSCKSSDGQSSPGPEDDQPTVGKAKRFDAAHEAVPISHSTTAKGVPVVRDVSKVVSSPPALQLDLSRNLILGDPYDKAFGLLRDHATSLAKCLQHLEGPARVKPPTSIDLRIGDNGVVSKVRLFGKGAERAQACLAKALASIRFEAGRERMGRVKLKSVPPPDLLKDPRVDVLRWTKRAGGFEIAMQASRRQSGPGLFHVQLEARLTALKRSRGVGHSLRYNSVLHTKDGGSRNSFSLQTATKVEKCLQPGQSEVFEREAREPVRRGERLELSVYILGGRCKDGKGRSEVGMVNLDWTRGDKPTLYVGPAWLR